MNDMFLVRRSGLTFLTKEAKQKKQIQRKIKENLRHDKQAERDERKRVQKRFQILIIPAFLLHDLSFFIAISE